MLLTLRSLVEQAGSAEHQISPAGFANASEFSTHALNATLGAAGFANASEFSAHSVNATLAPDGALNASAFSTHELRAVLAPAGLENASAFSAHSVNATLAPAGVENLSAFGAHSLNATLAPAGAENVSAFGTHSIGGGAPAYQLEPAGFANVAEFGQATLDLEDGGAPAIDGPWTPLTGEYPKPRRLRELEPPVEGSRPAPAIAPVVQLRQIRADLRKTDAEAALLEALVGEPAAAIVSRGTPGQVDEGLAIALLLAA